MAAEPVREADAVVHWRPLCMYCLKLWFLVRFTTRLRCTWLNIWRDEDAAAYVRSVADGNETVPTVRVGSTALVDPSQAAGIRSQA
ncbi:NrdH-redoxin [Streptomyces sp. t39]|uniref:NrdH-redoxin n=1 Tax=Streptomyces sp. t39 TaxID=1828156 RepID=UPI0011CDC4B7|nr:NrdH-redoxin [Streptomyces sp. t39]TXS56726.1 NrdH-redoxin [Streptomyces sp. t39]